MNLRPFRRCPAAALAAAGLLLFTGCVAGPAGHPSQPAAGSCPGKTSLAASGSSAQADAMTVFATAYERACRGHDFSYTSTGSAAGRAEFISGTTDFGGTDSPLGLDPAEQGRAVIRCGGHRAWNLPVVFGAIAIIYNLAGVDSLVLDAATTAKIFNGSVATWDAPEIRALNPGQDLPGDRIVVVSRSDASGTTENFQRYLAAAAGPAWGRDAGQTFDGVAGRSAAGNEGVWEAMRAAAGSIAYTAWPFAKRNGLSTVDMITAAGPEPVPLSAESVHRSLAAVPVTGPGDDVILDPSAAYRPTRRGAYPIVIISYEAVCSRYPDPQTAGAVREFLTVALGEAQADLAPIGYVPVPAAVRDRVSAAVAAIS